MSERKYLPLLTYKVLFVVLMNGKTEFLVRRLISENMKIEVNVTKIGIKNKDDISYKH